MAIHYSPSHDAIACGRTGSSLSSTEDQAQVSCKLCLRTLEKRNSPAEAVRKTPSLAELRHAARAAKAVEQAPLAVVRPAARVAKSAWQQRLEQLPGRNRLPRGLARQTFV